jgi:hypothetical protein
MSNKMSYTTDQRVFIKPFTSLLVLAMVWGKNIIEVFLFVLHHWEVLLVGLLNSLKKRGKGRKHCSSVRKENVTEEREAVIWNPRGTGLLLAQVFESKPAMDDKSAVNFCRCFRTKCTWVSYCQMMKQRRVTILRGSTVCYWMKIPVSRNSPFFRWSTRPLGSLQ